MSQAPAGWFPQDDGRLRYWDGESWTDHFHDPLGAQTKPKPAAPVEPREAKGSDPLQGLHRKARSALEQNLAAGELVQVVILGSSNQAIIGTDRRAFVFKKGLMAGASFGSEMTSWAYRNLLGVQLHTGMVSGAVILQGPGQSGAKTSYWQNSDSDAHKAPNAIPVVRPFDAARAGVARLRLLVDSAHEGTGPKVGARPLLPQPSAANGILDELERLATLRQSGAITEDEFIALKVRLIG